MLVLIVPMTRLIVFALAGAAVLLIAGAVLYLYPEVMIMFGGKGSQLQQTLNQEQIRSGSDSYPQENVTVNHQILIADISATNELRTKGLSVKDALAENEAMLFVFDVEGEHRFWMKDMKFPIDIIWISSDKIVVDIENNLQPCRSGDLCSIYAPDGNSLYVLETVSGFASKYGIVKGMPVEFDLSSHNLS
jgi:uncharacterized membrane protein (UPF0127 family)